MYVHDMGRNRIDLRNEESKAGNSQARDSEGRKYKDIMQKRVVESGKWYRTEN